MRTRLAWLTAMAAALAPGTAGAAELTLDASIALALAQNPALAAIEELRQQVAGGVVEARAEAFPQLALASSWEQSRSPAFLNSPDFEEILEQFPGGAFEPSTQELTRASVELSQPLYTFGKIGAAIELARIVSDAAEAQIDTARLDTATTAAEAYFRVLAAREGLATIETEREFRQRDLERVESLLEIGEATELERLRALAAAAEVEPVIARRRGEVVVAETELRGVLGLPPREPLELTPVPRVLPDPPAPDALVDEAVAARPELDDLALQAQAFAKQQVVRRAEGRPQIDLDGYWGREVRLVENFDDPLYSAWALGVGLRWEFFDGGRRRGQILQLASEQQQRELERADLEARVRLEVDRAHSDYLTARARAEAAHIAAAAAGEALRVARENYEQGIATQTDLLDSQSRAIIAEVVGVESFYDALVQAARLARAVGRMPNAGWRPAAGDVEP